MRNIRLASVAISGTFVLSVLTLLILCGHEASGLGYNHPLPARDVAGYIALATRDAFAENFTWSCAHWMLLGLGVAMTAMVATARSPSSATRAVAFAAQGVLVWPGWLGLLALPSDLASFRANRLDGEYLGEAWPMLELEGVWILIAFTLCALELFRVAATRATERHAVVGYPGSTVERNSADN